MFALLRITLNVFSSEPKLPLIRKVGPSSSTKKLSMRLPERHNELLSTPKIIIFLVVSLLKRHEPALSNVIP